MSTHRSRKEEFSLMDADGQSKLERRVVQAAEAALADRHVVTAIDVLVGIGWLAPPHADEWRQGRIEYLERALDPEAVTVAVTAAARHDDNGVSVPASRL